MSESTLHTTEKLHNSSSTPTPPTLSGGNRQKLGKRRTKTYSIPSEVKTSILNSQLWPSSKNDVAIKALNISALSILKTMRLRNSMKNQVYLIDTQMPSTPKEKGRKIYISLYLHANKITK